MFFEQREREKEIGRAGTDRHLRASERVLGLMHERARLIPCTSLIVHLADGRSEDIHHKQNLDKRSKAQRGENTEMTLCGFLIRKLNVLQHGRLKQSSSFFTE